ncbi:MAG: serine--tRNA ligase [Patescibacteria group bacterium]
MLDIKYIRENLKLVKELLGRKNIAPDVIDAIIEADQNRRGFLQQYEEFRKKQNEFSERVIKLFGTDKEDALSEMKTVKIKLVEIEAGLKIAEDVFQNWMYKMPNIPFDDTPIGKNEADNVVIREVGDKRSFPFSAKDYIVLGEALDLIDTERAAKVSGARFSYLKHEAPLFEFALVQFVFSRLLNEGWIEKNTKKQKLSVPPKPFIPLVPPVMIRPEVYRAMGRLDPGQEDERYFLPKDNLYLVGSGEHTTGPMHMEEVFDENALPHRHVAFSTCFRREAGAYGKDTRGIIRVHQFDKIELFVFAHPEKSQEEHKLLVGIQEALMQELKIPYRVVSICAGDMGWPDAQQYDIEAWMPGQNQYRETHSASNTTDFQSRRLNMKYKARDGSKNFVHTLNATAFAIGRTLIAILENYQNEDGSVDVPDVLIPYMHGITRIIPRKKLL